MSPYPWSALGLAGPADERAIRSAYARKLKAVRPDVDPTGFQALVEARDLAIDLARHPQLDDDDIDFDGDDHNGNELDDAHRGESHGTPVAAAVDGASPASADAQAVPGKTDIRAEVHQPATEIADETPPSVARPVSLDLDETSNADLLPPATGAPLTSTSRGAAETPPPVVPPELPLLQPDAVMARLRGLLSLLGAGDRSGDRRATASGAVSHAASGDIQQVLLDIERLPRSVRQMLEPDILLALSRAFEQPEPSPSWPRLAAVRRGLFGAAGGRESARDTGRKRRALLVALDESFGWTISDRRVYEVLPHRQAALLMAHLHASLSEARYDREGVPARWDGDGLPNIDAADLQAFFGSEHGVYVPFYQQAKSLRRWPPSWRGLLLVLAPAWLLPLRQYRLMAVWAMALIASGFLVNLVDPLLVPVVRRHWPAATAPLTVIANLLCFSPLAAVHLHIARNNLRLELERLARLAGRADSRRLFDPQARAKFLRARAPDFRFPSADGSSNSFWTSKWFWIVVGIAFFRLLAILAK